MLRFRFLSILFGYLFFGVCYSADAQQILSGTVYDASNNLPLAGAYVRSGNRSVETGIDGSFTLQISRDEFLRSGHPDFHIQDIPFERIEGRNEKTIFLTPGLSTIDGGTKVEAVRTPEFEYVFDYEFDGNILMVLSYMNKGSTRDKSIDPFVHCALTVFEFGKESQRTILPDYTQGIYRAPTGSVFIYGADTCFQLERMKDRYELRPMELKKFQEGVLPISAVIDTSVFLSYRYEILPQIGHFVMFPHLPRNYPVRFVRNHNYFDRVQDDFTMLSSAQLQRAEELEEELGVNRVLFAPYLRRFQYVIDLKSPYSPAYAVGRSLYIFDPMNQKRYRHNATGGVSDSTEVYYDLGKEELQSILQDPVTDKIYTVHERNGVFIVRQINHQSGAPGKPHKLTYPFPENLKIYGGYVYYIRHIVKEESNKHLYREKLPENNYAELPQ